MSRFGRIYGAAADVMDTDGRFHYTPLIPLAMLVSVLVERLVARLPRIGSAVVAAWCLLVLVVSVTATPAPDDRAWTRQQLAEALGGIRAAIEHALPERRSRCRTGCSRRSGCTSSSLAGPRSSRSTTLATSSTVAGSSSSSRTRWRWNSRARAGAPAPCSCRRRESGLLRLQTPPAPGDADGRRAHRPTMRARFPFARSRNPGHAAHETTARVLPPKPRDPATVREEILEHGLTADRARELADALEAGCRLLEALDVLVEANRLQRDVEVERRLVRLRRDAFTQLDRSLPSPEWPPFVPEDPPGIPEGARESTAGELTPGGVRSGIERHGSNPGLCRAPAPLARVARRRPAIDRAFEADAATVAGRATAETRAWYDPIDIADGAIAHDWVRKGQGVFAPDSPRALHEFLETVDEIGLGRLIAAYLGERPALSVEKCTLRRADTVTQHPQWHKDGACLSPSVHPAHA